MMKLRYAIEHQNLVAQLRSRAQHFSMLLSLCLLCFLTGSNLVLNNFPHAISKSSAQCFGDQKGDYKWPHFHQWWGLPQGFKRNPNTNDYSFQRLNCYCFDFNMHNFGFLKSNNKVVNKVNLIWKQPLSSTWPQNWENNWPKKYESKKYEVKYDLIFNITEWYNDLWG